MYYLDIMQRERIIWGMGKVSPICGDFRGPRCGVCMSCTQARKCTLVILGGTIWGQAWGYRERLTNANFWRSRIQSWSHLCAQHLMPCVTVNKASGNVCWVHLNSTSVKLKSTEFGGLHLWWLCLSLILFLSS